MTGRGKNLGDALADFLLEDTELSKLRHGLANVAWRLRNRDAAEFSAAADAIDAACEAMLAHRCGTANLPEPQEAVTESRDDPWDADDECLRSGGGLARWTTNGGDIVEINRDREVVVNAGRGYYAYDPEGLGLAIIAAGRWADEKAPVTTLEVIEAKRAQNVPNGTMLTRVEGNGDRPTDGGVVFEKGPGHRMVAGAKYVVLALPVKAVES